MDYYVHHVPGRLRIKIPEIKGTPHRAQEVRDLLMELPGIDTLSVNPITGSIKIIYNTTALHSREILCHLEDKGYFDGLQAVAERVHEKGKGKAGQALGKALFGWALGKALEGTGLSFIAALV